MKGLIRMSDRKASLERKSRETEIAAEINVDGSGKSNIKTQIGLLDHMLELFTFHGFFDLVLQVNKADLEIDIHHTNEDIGIVLGKLFRKALDEMRGIKRFGVGFSPMESTLGRTVLDISGRSYFSLKCPDMNSIKDQENYSMKYLEHFLESFANGLGATLNVTIEHPDEDLHTNVETVFKSLGQALDQATQVDPRREGEVPSTKGIID